MAGISDKAARRRGPGRPFPPGQSGNPLGRPRTPRELKEAMLAKLPERIARLEQLADSRNEKIALDANKYLIDRSLGRPTEKIAGDAEESPILFRAPTDAQMSRMAELVRGGG